MNGKYETYYKDRVNAFHDPILPRTQRLPPQVLRLAAREREVATIVYAHGACSAKDVQALLSAGLSNGAVRSMLVRLVRKGVLTRTCGNRGPNNGHYYLPAIMPADVRERALKEVSERYFDGSLLNVAQAAFNLLNHAPVSLGLSADL